MPYYFANSKAVACYYRLETSLLSDAVTLFKKKKQLFCYCCLEKRERVSFRGVLTKFWPYDYFFVSTLQIAIFMGGHSKVINWRYGEEFAKYQSSILWGPFY